MYLNVRFLQEKNKQTNKNTLNKIRRPKENWGKQYPVTYNSQRVKRHNILPRKYKSPSRKMNEKGWMR